MNESKVEGVYDEAKGKVKQEFGEVTGNTSVANSGVADQVKGHAEETWGKAKDATKEATGTTEADRLKDDASHAGHEVRDGVAHAAESVKTSVEHGIDNVKNAFKKD